MKEIKKYVCECCGAIYDSQDEANKCEQFHIKPMSISNCKYLSAKFCLKKQTRVNNNCIYPSSVKITMEDGQTLLYKRV